MPRPEKIAVLGGGISALTTVFELTNDLDWQKRYEITVYQLGWRVGGKGASGRTADGRIEEHGLHVWFGFYENAFHVMDQCYREYQARGLHPRSPIQSVADAFLPQGTYEYQELVNGRWQPWRMNFKITPGLFPGNGDKTLTLWEAALEIIRRLAGALPGLLPPVSQEQERPRLAARFLWYGAVLDDLRKVGTAVQQLERRLANAAHEGEQLAHLLETVAVALDGDPDNHEAGHHAVLLELLEALGRWLDSHADHWLATELRHLYILAALAVVHLRGLLADAVLLKGLESLNGEEYTAWLKRHGAAPAVWGSSLVRGLYDTAFCYVNGAAGDDNRTVAAGTAVYGLLRMFLTYQGALFFKMAAGMGDIVFSPLYAVLKARGVRFKFFHRVKNLRLSADKTEIAAIEMGRQVTLNVPEYDPLIMVKDLPCWPSQPRYEQIAEGERLKAEGINLESFWTPWQDAAEVTLEAGQDFDKIVLGISLGAFPYICRELIAAHPRWRAMVENLPTVWTQEYEFWFNRTLAELGRPGPIPLMMGYAEPGDVWTDMSHLLKYEGWPGDNPPQSISYLGSAMPTPDQVPPPSDHAFPAWAKGQIMKPLLNFLENEAAAVWPQGTDPQRPNSLDWNLLYAPSELQGVDRLLAQYLRVNIDPSERHVLSRENTIQYRMKADESGFIRLYLTGDWTNVGILSFGCIEGATMAGLLTAAAVSGRPADIID